MNKEGFLIGQANKARVIGRQGRKNPRYTCDSSRELITVLEYVSVKRQLLLFMIVTKKAYYYASNHIKG
jgi:hypothetical protein